jgi:hypothetical protein
VFLGHVVTVYGYTRSVTGRTAPTVGATLGATNDELAISGSGAGQICAEIPSGLTGTAQFESRVGTGSYFASPFLQQNGTATVTSTSSFPFRGCFTQTNWTDYRIRLSAASAGSTAPTILVSPGTGPLPGTLAPAPPSDGTNSVLIDACDSVAKVTVPISQTASTKYISQVSAKKNYICSIVAVAAAAEILNWVEGTGSTCGTSTAAVVGSTTVGNGLSFGANGGFVAIGGNRAVIVGIGTNVDGCLTQSGSNRISGFLTYVQR